MMAKRGQRPQVLAVKDKYQRIAFRREVGKLRDTIIAAKTLVRYDKAVKYFFEFTCLNNLTLAATTAELDSQLQLFIETLWQEGEPRSWAADTLSGLHHHLTASVKGRIKGAWRLHDAWVKCEIPSQAAPFLPRHIMAVAA